jgi:UrcA family protein
MTRIALIGLLFTAIPTAAFADSRTATVTVTTADMATPAARARLDRRIGAAIEEVCGSYAAIESSQVPEMDECWKAAKSEVRQRLASFSVKTRIQLSAR